MVEATSKLNLIEKVWSPREFKEYKFTILDAKTTEVGYEKLSSNIGDIKLWQLKLPENVVKELKPSLEESTKNIHSLTLALDKIASQELNTQVEIIHKQPGNLKSRFKTIQECLANLHNLRYNLENHDKVIQEYNSRFSVQGGTSSRQKTKQCPSHAKTIRVIQKVIKDLNSLKLDIQKELEKQQRDAKAAFDEKLSELETQSQQGQMIDSEAEAENLEKLIHQMDPKMHKEAFRRMHLLLKS